MQNATDVKAAAAASQGCSTGVSRGGFNRRMLYIALGVGAAAGLFLGWEWLVAVGAASLIVAVAPCLVMCALGLCMSRPCRNKTDVAAKTDTASTEAPVTRTAAAVAVFCVSATTSFRAASAWVFTCSTSLLRSASTLALWVRAFASRVFPMMRLSWV